MNFSIVIPCSGNATNLIPTIRSLQRVQYPVGKFEIIIVDNSVQSKPSEELISLVRSTTNGRLFREDQRGPSFARNSGAVHAKFPYLIFIDDDIIVKENFLSGYRKAWQNHPEATLIGGKIEVVLRNGTLTRWQQTCIEHFFWCFALLRFKGKDKKLQLLESAYSANMSIRRNEFLKEKFNTKLGIWYGKTFIGSEDYEFCQRMLLKGKEIVICSSNDTSVNHLIDQERINFFYILKRAFFNGIELYIMDSILIKRFPGFKKYVFVKQKIGIKELLSGFNPVVYMFEYIGYLCFGRFFRTTYK